MVMNRAELIRYLDDKLQAGQIKDFCPNGLQVEGKQEINKIITGVTASQALIDQAVAQQADAILVHHGYFWKGEAYPIVGMKKHRIAKLLQHDINLIAYHLPIDAHSDLGNNAQLGQLLGINNIKPVTGFSPEGIIMSGELAEPLTLEQLGELVKQKLNRQPLLSNARVLDSGESAPINTIAWCTGGGQGYIDEVAQIGVDAFLTGEASEQTIHSSRELGIDFIAAGHHATERYGVKAVGEHLAQQFGLDVNFIDINNPV